MTAREFIEQQIGKPMDKFSPYDSQVAQYWLQVWDATRPHKKGTETMTSDRLRDQDQPNVLGYDLDRKTLTPIRTPIDTTRPGDHGADPLGDGRYRMVPSGDVVDLAERTRRLAK